MMDTFKILIVEDNPADRETYRRLLARSGDDRYEILEADTGDEALRIARAERPDCVLLDNDLPDTHGLELLSDLRNGEGAVRCAIVMITGRGSETLAVDAMKRGVQDYIAKESLSATVLLHAVQNGIEKVRLRRQIEEQQRELERLYESEKQRRAELEQSVRDRDTFLAMLSHELRNPLSAVLAAGQLLNARRADAPMRAQAASMVMRQGEHMARMLDDLLDVARITRGQITLQKSTLTLQDLVQEAVEASRPMIEAFQHCLSVDLPKEPVLFEADGTRIEQVLVNLLKNAAKYTDRGGKISLHAGLDGDEVVFRVRDSGIGFDPQVLENLFDPFTQVGRSVDRSQGGLGLGLAVVRGIAQLHGGSVIGRSEGPGLGSEFEVRLPRGNVETTPPKEAPAIDRDGPLRVLVVEDHPAVREMTHALLSTLGHDVMLAEDGAKGLDALLAHEPDIALIDLGLPRLDGFEVARQFRRTRPRHPGQLLVALTGYGQPEDRRRALEAGFDAHLVKPLRIDEFAELVKSVRP